MQESNPPWFLPHSHDRFPSRCQAWDEEHSLSVHQFYHILVSQENQCVRRRRRKRRALKSCLIPSFSSSPPGSGLALSGKLGTRLHRGTLLMSPDQRQDLGMARCKCQAREGPKVVGEATRGGTNRFHQALFAHLCSAFYPGCTSRQIPGDFSSPFPGKGECRATGWAPSHPALQFPAPFPEQGPSESPVQCLCFTDICL